MKQFVLLSLLFLILVLSGCKEAAKVTEEGDYVIKEGTVYYRGDKTNELVVHLLGEPPSLHPTNARSNYKNQILGLSHQRLYGIDISNGEMVPELAIGEPKVSDDKLIYTFELDPEAAWPDGTCITSKDVMFTMKALVCPLTDNSNQRAYFDFVKDVQIDPSNDRLITILFSSFYLFNEYFSVVPMILDSRIYDPKGLLEDFTFKQLVAEKEKMAEEKAIIEWATEFNDAKYGSEVALLQGGSGPYQIEEWVPGQRIIVTRNENYWAKGKENRIHSQHPDKIIFVFIRDDSPVELQIKQQEIDVSTNITTLVFKNLLENEEVKKNYHLDTKDRDGISFLALNNRPTGADNHPFFTDKRVRRAIAYSIPLQDIIDNNMSGYAERINSPVSRTNPLYNEKLGILPFDQEKAKELLDEAGWVDTDGDGIREKEIKGKRIPFSFSMMFPPNGQTMIDMANRIQAELANIGVECKPDPKSMGASYQQMKTHEYDAGLIAMSASHLPYDFKQLYHSDNWADGDNFFGFINEEADLLIDSLRVESNLVERKRMADRVQEIIYEEMPVIYFYNLKKRMAIHRRFNNADMYPIREHVFLNDLEMIRWEGE